MSGGFPHSDIHGSKPVPGSPWLNAGYHVLHRLLLPRHPPNALFALDLIQKEQDHPKTVVFPVSKACILSHASTSEDVRAVSVLDLNNIVFGLKARSQPLLGRPTILMLYLSIRCQLLELASSSRLKIRRSNTQDVLDDVILSLF